MRSRWVSSLILTLFAFAAANAGGDSPAVAGTSVDYRGEMIRFVSAIGARMRQAQPEFGVFPQNASELGADADYMGSVTGIGQEDIYYGYERDGRPTPARVSRLMERNLDRFVQAGKLVLTVDYPFRNENRPKFDRATRKKINRGYTRAAAKRYVHYATVRSLAYPTRNPGHLPRPNNPRITTWDAVREWSYQLQPAPRQSRAAFQDTLATSGYDLAVIDYSADGSDAAKWTPAEIASLKARLGGKVVAYLSIGEAERYRYYWQRSWDANRDGRPDAGAPAWLGRENPDWPGNYKVRYWDPAWQQIIFGYADRIAAQGFDGVYLDIIDAYEYYQERASRSKSTTDPAG